MVRICINREADLMIQFLFGILVGLVIGYALGLFINDIDVKGKERE